MGSGSARWRAVATWALAALVFVTANTLFWSGLPDRIRLRPLSKEDQNHWVTMAATTSHHGTMSRFVHPTDRVFAPTSYREPLYPALLALQMWLHPDLRDLSVAEIDNDQEGHPALTALQYPQNVVQWTTSVLAVAVAWTLTGSPLASGVAGSLVLLSRNLVRETSIFRNEGLAAMLLTATSLALALAFRRRRARVFALAGALGGLLALTKAVFGYFWIAPPAAAGYLAWRLGWDRRRTAAGVGAFLIGFAIVVAPWMARNYVHFGRAYIAERGGVVLYLRALYDQMEPDEFRASFIIALWPIEFARERLQPLIHPSSYRRLLRENSDGFYQSALARRAELIEEHAGDQVAADDAQVAEALALVAAHPMGHLRASLPLGLGGIFVERDLKWSRPKIPGVEVSVVLFVSFWILCGVAIWRARPVLLAAVLPALFGWGFYTLLSHNIPRYNQIALPILYVSVVVLGVEVWRGIVSAVGRVRVRLAR